MDDLHTWWNGRQEVAAKKSALFWESKGQRGGGRVAATLTYADVIQPSQIFEISLVPL